MEMMTGEPVDFDRLSNGSTIQIFNYLDNTWKTAIVQEIDLAEREILVTYDDDTQEWIGVDGRRICFPPVNKSNSSNSLTHQRRASFGKTKKQVIESKSKAVKDVKKHSSASVVLKKSHHTLAKSTKSSDMDKKVSSKSSSSSSFLRLKFKPNNKNVKPSAKTETTKKRKREKLIVQETTASSGDMESDHQDVHTKKVVSKVPQSRLKEFKKDTVKLKIRIGKSENGTVLSKDSSSIAEKVETLSFNTTTEKKIKTLLPKRSVPETSSKTFPPDFLSQESPISASSATSLPTPYPAAIGTPTLNPLPISSGYVCPKQDCKKQFRNENLLMMHIKHYHREYRNMLQSMPNVADLAYARTVGEQIESPQANFLEKIAKLEEDKSNKSDDSKEIKMNENSVDEKTSAVDNGPKLERTPSWSQNIEGGDVSKSISKSNSRRTSLGKRSSGSELSPKLSVLLAQLQGPPLVPSSLTIEPDTADLELSVPLKKLSSVSSPQLSERSDSFIDSDEKPDCGNKSPTKKRRLSQLDSTDVINCGCGYGFEDGLMIQCVLCQCWQHGSCVGFENESDVPPNYTCETCQFPRRCHSSRRYSYVQNWLKEGIMPKFQFNYTDEEVRRKREKCLKHINAHLCELTELRHAIRSIQLKNEILTQTPDHPKLYLWAKSWDDEVVDEKEKEENRVPMDIGPIPEAPIDMRECRKNLSEHITKEISKVDKLITAMEEKVDELDEEDYPEGEDDDNCNNEIEQYSNRVKQTFSMMLRDLSSLQDLKYCEQ